MPTIKFSLKKTVNESYDCLISAGALQSLPSLIKKQKLGNKCAIITDDKVAKICGKKIQTLLKKSGLAAEIFSFKSGEKSKYLSTVEKLIDAMLAKGFDRKDVVIALGGGVVGDVAGFLASIYMRGIPYIQIPTTLLAMVDSSVGGKTGVDSQLGKNLIGTFYQPKIVIIDLDFLKTLPDKQISNGLAEVIKYGAIYDRSFFEYLEKNIEKIIHSRDPQILSKIIQRSVKIKAEVVEADEKESGLRMILNYGHSYGHAIEKLSNFKLLHGFAVSIGIVIINKIAIEKGLMSTSDAQRIKSLLKRAGLPITTMYKPTMKDLMSDKKRQGDYFNFVIVPSIGQAIIHKEKCQ